MPTPKSRAAPRTARSRSAAPAAPAARVLRRFRVVFNAVKAHFRAVEKRAGIGGAQVWALSVVRDRPGINVKDLAQALDVHQSTASNLAKALVAQGFVGAERDGSDRRAVRFKLLPAGARVLRRAPAPFSGVLPQALASLDGRTLSRLDEDLGRVISALDADERSAGIPLADG